MKKILSLITLIIFCITTPVFSNEPPPVENPDTESPPDLSSPVYATDNAPFRERTEDKKSAPLQKHKKAAAVVIGTLAAVTIGLLVSGADTGKHIHPRENRIASRRAGS